MTRFNKWANWLDAKADEFLEGTFWPLLAIITLGVWICEVGK